MKNIMALSGITLALLSASLQTQAQTTEQSWVGGFGLLYNDDKYAKVSSEGAYDDGRGFGLEYGFRFSNEWAVRAELTALTLDYLAAPGSPSDDSGMLFGVDAMYFLANDAMYIFGGLKRHSMEYSANLANVGFGKHWSLSDNLKLITEMAVYHDFGQSFNDYSVKLGLAYTFGESTASAPVSKPTVAPVAQVVNTVVDTDNDGVADTKDSCPNTAAGTKVDMNGCPLPVKVDTDKDGVADELDKCPDTPVNDKVDEDGCTQFDEKTISFNLDVKFANNSSQIEEPNNSDIQKLVQFLKRYGKTSVEVEGHTSAPGSAEYNMWLSQRRAEAFRDMLINTYGISAERVTAQGYGETQLLDSRYTAEAPRVNRRITVKIEDTVKVRLTK